MEAGEEEISSLPTEVQRQRSDESGRGIKDAGGAHILEVWFSSRGSPVDPLCAMCQCDSCVKPKIAHLKHKTHPPRHRHFRIPILG